MNVFYFLSVVCLSATLFAQGLVVCPKCGREARGAETSCRHCKAALPLPRHPSPPASPSRHGRAEPLPQPGHAAGLSRILAVRVAADLAEARRLLASEPGTALAFYQNAFALHRLSMDAARGAGAPASSALDKEIVSGMRDALARLQRGWVRCPRCKGSGKQAMVMKKRDGRDVKGPQMKCKACGGNGGRVGRIDPALAKAAVLRGANEFMKIRLAAGDEKIGRVCLPPGIKRQLTNRQKALVLSAVPAACPDCGRGGRETCSKCRGTGLTRCTANGCQRGRVQERRKNTHGVIRATRIDDSLGDLCPVCEGTGEVSCGSCGGTGGQPCRKCGGSGEAPACRRCAGAGIVACTKCKSAGEVRGKPCLDCRGEGEVLCGSCQGDGTK